MDTLADAAAVLIPVAAQGILEAGRRQGTWVAAGYLVESLETVAIPVVGVVSAGVTGGIVVASGIEALHASTNYGCYLR